MAQITLPADYKAPAAPADYKKPAAPADYTAAGEEYRETGICKLEGLLDEETLAHCQRCYDWAYENPSPIAATFFQGPEGFYNDGQCKGNNTIFKELLEAHGKLFAKACQDLWGIGPEGNVWFYSAEIFHKKGGTARYSPFHQDSSYIPFHGIEIAQIWFNFEELTPKKNALAAVRGSHNGPLYNGLKVFSPGLPVKDWNEPGLDDTTPIYEDPEQLAHLPRLPDVGQNLDKFDVQSYELKRGDATVFHPAALHGGAATDAEFPERHTLVLRFMGEKLLYRPLPIETNMYGGKDDPMFAGLKPLDPFVYSKKGRWQRVAGPGLPGLNDIPVAGLTLESKL